jgi:branched-chain amino acid transport system ATP-binding protein
MTKAKKKKTILELNNVTTHYGPVLMLQNIDIKIYPGTTVCLLGGNASGKTTTLKTILGMVVPSEGEVILDGKKISGQNISEIVAGGISMVPENRRLFGRMSVKENLEMGAFLRSDTSQMEEDFENIFKLFPRVKERLHQKAGTLSGGEQQMVAVGRALMSQPKVLLMDEPSMGLAPLLVQNTFEIIQRINEQGTTVFVVEQNANMALSIADYGYVLQTGKIVLADTAKNLLENKMMREAYLGEL